MRSIVSSIRSVSPLVQAIEDAKQTPETPATASPCQPMQVELQPKEETEATKPDDSSKETETEHRNKMQKGSTAPFAGHYDPFCNVY